MVEDLVDGHAISVLPDRRPEHTPVARGGRKESKDEQNKEHFLRRAAKSSINDMRYPNVNESSEWKVM